LTLRALAVVLVVVGLGELMLFLSVVQTIVAANTHGGGFDAGLRLLPSGPGQPYFAQSPETLVKNLAPEAAIVICSVVSLWAAYTVLRYHRRYHWRRTGVGVVGALAIDVAFLYALSYTFTPPAPRWSDTGAQLVPNAAALAAAGLVGRPARGQPTRPATVDGVYADTTATYVRYAVPDAPHDGQPNPTLYDDRGRSYGFGEGGSSVTPIKQLMPWRPPIVGFANFPPLRPDAHAAVLRFSEQGRVMETVRVPLNLGALRRAARVSDPAVVVAVHGITLTLTTVTRGIGVSRIVTHLDEEPRVGPVTSVGDVLLDAHGRRIPFADARGSGGVPLGGHFTFTSTYGFVTPPSGARLVLVIPGMQYDNTPVGTAGAVIHGPWRLPFTMP